MGENASSLEELIAEFRRTLPAQSSTAQAIDQGEPWERIALKAVEDGYIEVADQFNRYMEACLRRGM